MRQSPSGHSRWLSFLLLATVVLQITSAWVQHSTRSSTRITTLSSSSSDSNVDPLSPAEKSTAQQQQEQLMEELSSQGSKAISSMSVAERTKRAMLAEAVEDRIFDLTEQLEQMFDETTGNVPEDKREQAVQVAQQCKAFQLQYEELVTGAPSSLLTSMDGIGEPDKNGED